MKSERRHELQQNELASQVDKLSEGIQPYGTTILVVFALVLVAGLIWAWRSGSEQAMREQSWSAFQAAQTAQDPELLQQMAKQNEGTLAGYWALQTAADVKAAQGSELIFTDKKQAEETLTSAANLYKEVTNATVENKLLSQRAWLGYAKTQECLFGVTGDGAHLDNARKAYQKVAEGWPESNVGKVAANRLTFLNGSDSKQFYNWLAEFKPTPPPLTGGGQGLFDQPGSGQGSGAGRELQLPDELQLPEFDLGTEPEANSAPAAGEAAPATTQPAPETDTP